MFKLLRAMTHIAKNKQDGFYVQSQPCATEFIWTKKPESILTRTKSRCGGASNAVLELMIAWCSLAFEECLRFTHCLTAYANVMYIRNGRRLSTWTFESHEQFGYLKLEKVNEVPTLKFAIGESAGTAIACPLLSVAPDVVLIKNLTLRSAVHSKALSVTSHIIFDLNKRRPENTEPIFEAELNEFPSLAVGELPAWLLGHCKFPDEQVLADNRAPGGHGGAVADDDLEA
jgi:hypothetical protein